MGNLPISITVHAMNLFFERERPQQPVSSSHQACFGHDEALELPRELGEARLYLLLARHHHQHSLIVTQVSHIDFFLLSR